MCGSMALVDIQSTTAEIRQGKKIERRNHRAKIMSAPAMQGGNKHICFDTGWWKTWCTRLIDLIEQGLMSHSTRYRSYHGRVFMAQMTPPTVSKRWRTKGSSGPGSIPRHPLHHTTYKTKCKIYTHHHTTTICGPLLQNIHTQKWI